MVENFEKFSDQIKGMSSIIGASKSSEIVGMKFKSLLSISGDIMLGKDFKESLSSIQLEKFSWLGDNDITIKGGVLTLVGLDNKPKAFWLNTAILAQLVKAKCLTKEGDILPSAKGISGEFHTDSVKFAKKAKVAEAEPVEDDDLPF